PFERTAVNGFGFLQIIRKRERANLIELLRADPVETAALALLRRAERHGNGGAVTLTAAPAIIDLLHRKSDWIEQLAKRRGGAITLTADATLALGAGHVA
ncbi:MAG: ribonuclease, partial [Alphaproteobacteria bacterium]|nr:ribonuclease [Alphaproteobacteria bacterium]